MKHQQNSGCLRHKRRNFQIPVSKENLRARLSSLCQVIVEIPNLLVPAQRADGPLERSGGDWVRVERSWTRSEAITAAHERQPESGGVSILSSSGPTCGTRGR